MMTSRSMPYYLNFNFLPGDFLFVLPLPQSLWCPQTVAPRCFPQPSVSLLSITFLKTFPGHTKAAPTPRPQVYSLFWVLAYSCWNTDQFGNGLFLDICLLVRLMHTQCLSYPILHPLPLAWTECRNEFSMVLKTWSKLYKYAFHCLGGYKEQLLCHLPPSQVWWFQTITQMALKPKTLSRGIMESFFVPQSQWLTDSHPLHIRNFS